jgi:hypothetical protein
LSKIKIAAVLLAGTALIAGARDAATIRLQRHLV